MAAAIDIKKAGKYPIVLSDALLGKSSKELYTGVRCKFILLLMNDIADLFSRQPQT
jgi:hypothetical protein